MYLQHFGLSQEPFSLAPDPRFVWMSERHREALAHMLFGMGGADCHTGNADGGFILLSGEIGTGKTTMCRCLLQQLPAHCNLAYILNPKLNALELLQSICQEFGLAVPDTASGKQCIDAINAFLLQAHGEGKVNLLVVDEAQNLSADVLEQLRLLTNLETNERKLLQIILVGQPELRKQLRSPQLEQLAQRVVARYHLGALTPEETLHYVEHRLRTAGLQGQVPFEPAALRRIYKLTAGIPRRINLLCARALLGAYSTGQAKVNRSCIRQAAQEVFDRPSPLQRWHGFPGVLKRAAFVFGVLLLLWQLTHTTLPWTKASAPVRPVAGATKPAMTKPDADNSDSASTNPLLKFSYVLHP